MSLSMKYQTRFETTAAGGQPAIFWDDGALGAKKPKKFSYKKKEQKFPLRSKTQNAPPAPPPAQGATRQPAPPAGKAPANQRPGGSRPAANRQPGSKGSGVKANKGAADVKKKPGVDVNSVTLTQNQLDSILETIGQLTVENSELKTQIDLGPPSQTNPSLSPRRADPVTDANPEMSHLSPRRDPVPAPAAAVSVQPQSVPGLTAAQQPASSPRREMEPPPAPAAPVSEASRPQPGYVPSVPKAPLSNMEKKRLQWEKERAEVAKVENWSPWGRPGAGAPLKDQQGNLLADFNTRKSPEKPKDVLQRQTMEQSSPAVAPPPHPHHQQQQQYQPAPPAPSAAAAPSAGISSQRQFASTMPAAGAAAAYNPVTGGQSGQHQQPLPAAIRSSFAIGEIAPNENRFMSAKEREKQQWLLELEQQREEQRLRKQQEKDRQRLADERDTWADKFATGYKPARLPEQPTKPMAAPTSTVDDSALRGGATEGQGGARINSAPHATAEAPVAGTHLRGQNAFVDPVSRQEHEEKRKKFLEHQEYIRQQMEEHEQQKRRERERRIQEELAEERRLAQEREAIQRQADAEKEKVRQKEEAQKRQLEQLKEAMERAQEDAEREKHEKRMKKLQKGGHDFTHYHATFEDVATPRAWEETAPPGHMTTTNIQSQSHDQKAKQSPRLNTLNTSQTMHVEPLHIPGLTARDDPPAQSQRGVDTALYTENRVLTPTSYRKMKELAYEDPTSPRREFSTQTEIDLPTLDRALTREATVEIEYKGPLYETREGRNKKVRVKSAPKEAKPQPQQVKPSKPVKISERPKWGSQGDAKKKNVKQSERDPFYEQKKRRAEILKQERQKKLSSLVQKNTALIRENHTVASRTRSRSRSKSRDRVPSPPVPALVSKDAYDQYARTRSPGRGGHVPHEGHQHRSRLESHRRSVGRVTPRECEKPSADPRTESPELLSVRNATYDTIPTSGRQSPPVPALKHRMDFEHQGQPPHHPTPRSRYTDSDPISAPVPTGEFVPYMRSSAILNPANAQDPMPLSREASAVGRARKAYTEEKNPGKFGTMMENYMYPDGADKDEMMEWEKDPILNPGLVKDHPTTRQDRILQQLSSLRRGLMMKRRELEVGLNAPEGDEVEAAS